VPLDAGGASPHRRATSTFSPRIPGIRINNSLSSYYKLVRSLRVSCGPCGTSRARALRRRPTKAKGRTPAVRCHGQLAPSQVAARLLLRQPRSPLIQCRGRRRIANSSWRGRPSRSAPIGEENGGDRGTEHSGAVVSGRLSSESVRAARRRRRRRGMRPGTCLCLCGGAGAGGSQLRSCQRASAAIFDYGSALTLFGTTVSNACCK
jgi:hypothetical protein